MKLKNNPYYYLFYKINVFLVELFDRYDETNGEVIMIILSSVLTSHLHSIVLLLSDYPMYDGMVKDSKYYYL